MMTTTNIAASTQQRSDRIAMEEMMLGLFSPAASTGATGYSSRFDNASLWRSDAIHRAKNMAQMTVSLANLAEHPSRGWLPDDLIAKTRGLARAYCELGSDWESSQAVPCVPLLSTIAVRLAEIFGSARDIAVSVDADTVNLVPDMRRALILMCSEMIINALKYGYPGSTGGTIRVSLKNHEGALALVVENDGVDFAKDCPANQGSALLDRLGAVLGASIVRGSPDQGHGYRIGATVAPAPTTHLAS